MLVLRASKWNLYYMIYEITYNLLRFHPDLLYIAVSTSVAVVFWEIVYTRLGCYFLSIPFEASMLDLLSYYGYKFVGIIVTDTVKLLGGKSYISWFIFFYTSFSVSFFLVNLREYGKKQLVY